MVIIFQNELRIERECTSKLNDLTTLLTILIQIGKLKKTLQMIYGTEKRSLKIFKKMTTIKNPIFLETHYHRGTCITKRFFNILFQK